MGGGTCKKILAVRYSGENPPMLKLDIQHNIIRNVRQDFWHTFGASGKSSFIGKRQGQFQDEKISTNLVESERVGDPFT